MGMIVQTLSVLETNHEPSLDEAIAQKFEAEPGDRPRITALADDQALVATS